MWARKKMSRDIAVTLGIPFLSKPHSYQLFLRKELSENGYDKMSDGG